MTTYSCPMHPDVQSDRPMTCSKCGMSLVQREEDRKTTGSRAGEKAPRR